jgi:phage gpG-like protein
MAAGVSIGAVGLNKLIKELDLVDQAINVEEILDVAGAFLLNQIKTRFLAETAPDGSIWPESGAAANRKAKGVGGGTLFASGDLWNSIMLGRGGPGFRTIFTDVSYAPDHNFGQNGQVKREFMAFNAEDEDEVDKIIEARIALALRSL